MARPKKAINEDQVLALARIHCTYEEMAAVLGCSSDTLSRRFAELIEKGRQEGRMSLRREQFKLALSGDRTMLIWLGKQHLGQSDRHELGGQLEAVHRIVHEVVETREVPQWPEALLGGDGTGGNGQRGNRLPA